MKDIHPFLPNLHPSIKGKMLKALALRSEEELFEVIPEDLRIGDLKIPSGMTEDEVERYIDEVFSENQVFPSHRCFLGGGVWPHYVPPVVDTVISRAEFYTSYTPYQPEVSQGNLQALFEYQSLICDLTGMDIASSSLYDWPTAVGEAVRMAMRVKKRSKIAVAKSVGPERLQVLKTYCSPVNAQVEVVGFEKETGRLNLEVLERVVDDSTACLYMENPNFFGVIEEDVEEACSIAHRNDALFVAGFEPFSLGILKPPGEYGADLAVAEGQPLGLHLNYGGPLLGVLASKDEDKLLRQMPGRIIGETLTRDGSRKGYVMVLQTREQHIRREAATSNICTNQALCAIAAATYFSTVGAEGFRSVAEAIMANSHYAAKVLGKIPGVRSPAFDSNFFQDFAVDFGFKGERSESFFLSLAKEGFLGGLPLRRFYSELEGVHLFSATEIHRKKDVDQLQEAVRRLVS